MLQKHPISKSQPLILKVEGKHLSSPESVQDVIESISNLKPAIVALSAYPQDIERFQKIADLFFAEHPEESWHLFEDFRRLRLEFARKLGMSSKVQKFLQEMKSHIQEQSDVDTFLSGDRYREQFTNFLLCQVEQLAMKVIFSYFLKKNTKKVKENSFQVDTRNIIVFGKDKEKKPVPNLSETVENFSKILKNNPGKIIFLTGNVAQENRYLGPDGISVTVALVQSAYEKNGIESVLVQPQTRERVFEEVFV